jgi:predicted outer membrane protein
MKISTLLMATGFFLGLAAKGVRAVALSPKRQEELIAKVVSQSIAALKSSELGMEKSASSYLRDTASKFHNELHEALGHLIVPVTDDMSAELKEIYTDAQAFQFFYEYNESAPFDNEFIKHQIAACGETLSALRQLSRSADASIRKVADTTRKIVSRYHSSLENFERNFLSIDEHRIRDFAHQIWESEGRPEGQAVRHWAMAVELSKKLTSAELQLAFEQKRSAVDLLSTTKFDQNSAQESIH